MSTIGERRQALREQIVRWNQHYPVGTTVNCEVYPGRIHRTSSPATLLFERKAVIYLEGFSGYFHLDEVHPLAESYTMAEKRTAYLFPGQGAQSRGMGRELFAAFPEQTRLASQVLGYSIERLCLDDQEGLLDQTRYTQVAIYVVNALGYRHHLKTNPASRPAFLMGHSIGEYNALLAADVFDFETGLRLVMKRGELMGNISGGAMAAVRGTPPERIRETLHSSSLDDIDLANYNTPSQTVISGPAASIERAVEVFTAQRIKAARLRVSGAFHSRYMQIAQQAFSSYLRAFTFAPPKVPVIANATGTPYEPDHIAEILCAQIASPVRWLESIRYILDQGEMEFAEIGSTFLHGMVREISASSLAVK